MAAIERFNRGTESALCMPGGGPTHALNRWLYEWRPRVALVAESVGDVEARNRRMIGIRCSLQSAQRRPRQAAGLGRKKGRIQVR